MKEVREQQQQQGMYRPEFEHDNCGIGAVVNIKGKKTHDTVANALKIVEHLEHRAGKDAEGKTGDGVGILLQISHKFFKKACKKEGFEIGDEREYGIAQFFFPQHEIKRAQAKKMFEIILEKEGLELLGWRQVPVFPEVLGHKARECMPCIMQAFIKKPEDVEKGLPFDRMGYIDSFEEIMAMETGFLQYAMNLLKTEYAKEVQILKLEIPDVSKIPAVRFDVAKELVSQKYNRKIRNPFDLEPEEEALIGQYFKEEYGSDFVFVTHYPSKKRPFYAMDDPEDARFTLSFDLLFKGLEITTGGQRIHDYNMLVQKIEDRGMTQEGMEQYLDTFKHGMPPHGGLGIGLERLTMQLIGEENVRETCLFPRDMNRLEP